MRTARELLRTARAFLRLAAVFLAVPAMALAAPAVGRRSDGAALRGGAVFDGRDAAFAALERSPPSGSAAWERGCSATHPVCVRRSPGAAEAVARATLEAVERAWDALVGVLGVPAPEGRDGGPWEVYVVDTTAGSPAAFFAGRDPRTRFDRAISFGLVDASTSAGCALDRAAARAVARGSIWRAAPATDDASATAQVEALVGLATPCAGDVAQDDDALAFQSAPERSVADGESRAFERGAAMFYGWLEARFGTEPGALLVGAWALAPTRTTPDAWRDGHWATEPGTFDVFRASLANALWKGSTLDDIFGQFAVARAAPPLAPPPPAAAWTIPWPDHARRLASPRAVAPMGASYVVVGRAGAPAGARLHLEAQWEDYGRMRWAAAKVDAAGAVLAVLPIAATDRATSAAVTVEGLDAVGVDHVVVVGANVGSTEHAFRPDQREWEPHGWTLTVEGE